MTRLTVSSAIRALCGWPSGLSVYPPALRAGAPDLVARPPSRLKTCSWESAVATILISFPARGDNLPSQAMPPPPAPREGVPAMRRADRLFDIIQTLRAAPRPLPAAALAERLEVTARTIYRDVASLQASRVPIEGAAGIGYVLRQGFDLPPLMFTAD